ncbi:ABC transporter permease [Bartonella tamiae]|nr:ABC transporter permease subunit [Bartonella tamiae]
MLLPLVALSINAVSTQWSKTIIPSGFTLDWLYTILTQNRFHYAILRSLTVSILSLILAIVLTTPAILIAHTYWPALDRWLSRFVILPYAIPGIVLVVGYIKVFSVPPLQINGTLWILIFVYVPLCFPMFYICLKNSLNAIPVQDYLDAGRLVGATDEKIFIKVIIPLLIPAFFLSTVLNFSLLMSEFVYANLLVGGQYETLQIYIYAHRTQSGSLSSAMILIYFLFLFIMTIITLIIQNRLLRKY